MVCALVTVREVSLMHNRKAAHTCNHARQGLQPHVPRQQPYAPGAATLNARGCNLSARGCNPTCSSERAAQTATLSSAKTVYHSSAGWMQACDGSVPGTEGVAG